MQQQRPLALLLTHEILFTHSENTVFGRLGCFPVIRTCVDEGQQIEVQLYLWRQAKREAHSEALFFFFFYLVTKLRGTFYNEVCKRNHGDVFSSVVYQLFVFVLH